MNRNDFADFFTQVRSYAPFAWQERLLDHLIEHGRWPELIDAPTSAGKTAVIEVHAFAVALSALGQAPRLPRRLSVLVARRMVIDAHYEVSQNLSQKLADATEGIVAEVAEVLRSLVHGVTSPLVIARLRGGMPPSRAWLDEPEACAVLCCTPDMWGSRLLFQGYGSSPKAWPREAGLLAVDSAVVVDESHLSQQLLHTAREVAAQIDSDLLGGVPVLQVVETTATPNSAADTVVGIQESDLDNDVLGRRMMRSKHVETVAVPYPVEGKGLSVFAEQVTRLHERYGSTVGCVVNRIDPAITIAETLSKQGLNVQLLIGRRRPADLVRLRKEYPHLLSTTGDHRVDVVVATQTIEVGVDVSFSAMVTEVAPGSAMTQRFGRTNRIGTQEETTIVVVGPAAPLPDEQTAGKYAPYTPGDLQRGWDWVRGMDDVSPWKVRQNPAPTPTARRPVYQHVEVADTWQWAATSERLFSRPDLELWLSDDLEEDTDAGVVVRARVPASDVSALQILRATPPKRHEVYSTRLGLLREMLPGLKRVFRWRSGDLMALSSEQLSSTRREYEVHPGDIYVLDAEEPIFAGGIPHPKGKSVATDTWEIDQVSSTPDASLRLGAAGQVAIPGPVLHSLPEGDWTRADASYLAEHLEQASVGTEMTEAVKHTIDLLRGRRRDYDIRVITDIETDQVSIIVSDLRREDVDEELRQTFTRSENPVSLERHSQAVGERTQQASQRLGLGCDQQMYLAGLHHDAGKIDDRFQRMLGAAEIPLAKSTARTAAQIRSAVAHSDVPTNWRHEQLSAALTWDLLTTEDKATRSLVSRLVGTSHGWGRTSFPHAGSVSTVLSARELFDEGVWDEIIWQTDLENGVWVNAYLEAVLRACDGQISKEGS